MYLEIRKIFIDTNIPEFSLLIMCLLANFSKIKKVFYNGANALIILFSYPLPLAKNHATQPPIPGENTKGKYPRKVFGNTIFLNTMYFTVFYFGRMYDSGLKM